MLHKAKLIRMISALQRPMSDPWRPSFHLASLQLGVKHQVYVNLLGNHQMNGGKRLWPKMAFKAANAHSHAFQIHSADKRVQKNLPFAYQLRPNTKFSTTNFKPWWLIQKKPALPSSYLQMTLKLKVFKDIFSAMVANTRELTVS